MYAAFADGQGGMTTGHIGAFFSLSIMREAFVNSLIVSLGAVVLSTLIAVPLAYLTVRFEFRGAALVQTLGILPLVMPPFVGAVAMQLLFGRNGSVNLLLNDAFGFKIPFMEGLNGVIFVEGLHYFPFILLNLVASMRNIDVAMEEAAQNLGCHGFRLFRRVVFPLALARLRRRRVAGVRQGLRRPGHAAGAQRHQHAGAAGLPAHHLDRPRGSRRLRDRADHGGVLDRRAGAVGAHHPRPRLRDAHPRRHRAAPAVACRARSCSSPTPGWGWCCCWCCRRTSASCCCRCPRCGASRCCPRAITLAHYGVVLTDSSRMIGNTMLYCTLAAGIDVVLGVAIAWLLLRTRLPGRHWLDWGASAALAIPGLVLAIGFLRAFRGIDLPFGWGALTASWIAIMLAYAVRRLPYAVRSCVAALEQVHVSLEEAAQSLGANRLRTIRRVVVPLIAGGILAGFVTSFITAAVELSATILLVTRESQAPLSYGIYLYNQSIATRGPAAALGVIAVAIVALGTWLSHRFLERRAEASQLSTENIMTDPVPYTAAAGIEIEGVNLAYGDNVVLRDVTLSIAPGEFFALLGPSGSGKSTLLRLIAGFNRANHGRVRLAGVDVAELPPWERDVGMVFQNYALWPHLSVAENVAFGLEERRWPKERIRERVREVLELVSLTGYDRRRPGQLSGGQQQRVAIARTLAIEPAVLLLDEPLSNLDAKLRASTGLELKKLQRRLGLTTVFVTHDQQEAMTIADRLAVLDGGVIQQIGTPRELYDAPVNRFVAEFVGSINLYPGRIDGAGSATARNRRPRHRQRQPARHPRRRRRCPRATAPR